MKDIIYNMITDAETTEKRIVHDMDKLQSSNWTVTKWNDRAYSLACTRERIRTLYELIGKLG